MREQLEALIAKFNARAREDAKLRGELSGIERTVVVDLKDGVRYHFTLKEAQIDGLHDGAVDGADITIMADRDTIRGLISREIGPMKAFALGRLKVKGDIEDLFRFRKFF